MAGTGPTGREHARKAGGGAPTESTRTRQEAAHQGGARERLQYQCQCSDCGATYCDPFWCRVNKKEKENKTLPNWRKKTIVCQFALRKVRGQ